MNSPIMVAGLQKQSLIDYPGKVAAVVFLAGCNMRCHYCHNRQLFDWRQNQIPWLTVLTYLQDNLTMLDAVVVSGGEPTLDPHLPAILADIKKLGLLVKLDTNGTKVDLVRQLVDQELIDYVALDVKAPAAKHVAITGLPITPVLATVAYLKAQNKIEYMLRTTLTPRLSAEDLVTLGATVVAGAPLWQIQQCRVAGAYPPEKVREIAKLLEKYAQHVVVKGL